MRAASSGFARPENSMSRLSYPASMLVRSVVGWGSMTLMLASTLVLPPGVIGDVALARAGHAEGPFGHVFGDDGTGRGVGVVAQLHRRDEGRVDRGLHPLAELRAGLLPGLRVVVGGDRGGPEVGRLSDVRVADVGEVRDLAARADVRVLDLDEGAGLA